MRFTITIFAMLFQGSFAAHSTCKGLGNFKLSCAAKGFVGSIVTAGNEAEELVQGKSSLTALHASGCSAIMERMFVDSEGKQNKYLVSCYYEDPDGEGDGIFDDDDGKLICSNDRFERKGSVNIKVSKYDSDDDNDHDSDGEGLLYLYGTGSSKTSLESWTDDCTLTFR